MADNDTKALDEERMQRIRVLGEAIQMVKDCLPLDDMEDKLKRHNINPEDVYNAFWST